MISGLATLSPLFVGPSAFLIGALLVIVLVLVIARVVIGATVLGVLWIVGAIGTGASGVG